MRAKVNLPDSAVKPETSMQLLIQRQGSRQDPEVRDVPQKYGTAWRTHAGHLRGQLDPSIHCFDAPRGHGTCQVRIADTQHNFLV